MTILLRRLCRSLACGWFLSAVVSLQSASSEATALLIVLGDQHSAYERAAQLVAMVDQLKAENPGLPMAILLNGDTLEYGNPIARRSHGEIDFAMFTALARRTPTILNLGNHEPEFYDMAESVKRMEATGVKVISNIADRATQQLFAPSSTTLKLGDIEAVIVGLSTDRLSTYRVAVQPSLDLADPVVWAKKNLPALLARAPLKIILSHAGIAADRQLFALVPDCTIFAGAHNHLRFVHPLGRTVYFHSGFWNEYASLVWIGVDADGSAYAKRLEQRALTSSAPADPDLLQLINKTEAAYLTTEDRALVGETPRVLSPYDAARFVVSALRKSVGADAAFIGNTTFGAGLPAGDVQRVQFDACVRFDGTVFSAEIDGVRLKALLSRCNHDDTTPFSQRTGEYLVADLPADIDAAQHYRIVTSDWGAKNSERYFGAPAIVWREMPGLRIKTAVLQGLSSSPVSGSMP